MLKKLVMIIATLTCVTVLAGCEPVESILNQIINIFEETTDEDMNQNNAEDKQVNNQTGENINQEDMEENVLEGNNNNDMNDTVAADEVDTVNVDYQPFDEKLAAEGYENLILPNGFPIQVPYQWILVKDNASDNMTGSNYEGTFCYNLPMMAYHEVADWILENNETSGETSSSSGVDNYLYQKMFHTLDGVQVTLSFFEDDYENDCVDLVIDDGANEEAETEEWTGPGEDPSTMVSEEELAEMEAYSNEQENEENQSVETGSSHTEQVTGQDANSRTRAVPDDYENQFALLQNEPDYFNLEGDASFLSIIETLTQSPEGLYFVQKGMPEVIPYEWYPVMFENQNAGWSADFCTDTTLAQAVVKHHHMLEAMNADIKSFEIYDEPLEGHYSKNEFALNDAFGTGSWQGETVFYIEEGSSESPFESHQCMQMNMSFSPEILD